MAQGAIILNPSFEETSPPATEFLGDALVNWSASAGSTGTWGINQGTSSLNLQLLPPDGIAVCRIYRRASVTSINPGDFGSLIQSVDLTNVSSISFDAALNQIKNSVAQGTWSSFLEAQFIIDGSVYWSKSQAGKFLTQSVDTSSLAGTHDLGFRLIAVGAGSELTNSDWFLFDNLVVTTIPEPSAASVVILSGICFSMNRRRTRRG